MADLLSNNSTIRIESYEKIAPGSEADQSLHKTRQAVAPTNRDFARLVPLNTDAKIAFDEIARIMTKDPAWCPHARKYITVNQEAEDLVTDDTSDEESLDTLGTPCTRSLLRLDQSVRILTGHYRFNLMILPSKIARGWVLGSGRLDLGDEETDILLTIQAKRDGVRGRHARIYYQSTSLVLMAKPAPKRRILLNGHELFETAQSVHSTIISLTIGKLQYALRWVVENLESYNGQLQTLVGRHTEWFRNSITSFDPTPAESHFSIRGYIFQSPQAAGASGVVSACIETCTGNVFAVKRVLRTGRGSMKKVEGELDILRTLGSHRHVCSLKEVIYSDGDHQSMGQRAVNDVYAILAPFAPGTLYALMGSKADGMTKLQAFHQCALGLEFVHSHGIIHRDIKPANILVVKREPLHVVIGDFGSATLEKHSQNHMHGTIPYLPPEITELKMIIGSAGVWSDKSDVFSLGKSIFELWQEQHSYSLTSMTKTENSDVIACLQSTGTLMDDTVAGMLNWLPADRPQMCAILKQSFWPVPVENVHETTKRIYESLE